MDVTEASTNRERLCSAFEQIKGGRTELRRMTDAVAAFHLRFAPGWDSSLCNQTVLDTPPSHFGDLQREDQRPGLPPRDGGARGAPGGVRAR